MNRRMQFSCVGCFRGRVGGSGDGKPTPSFLGGQQCACRASSGDVSEEDKPPFNKLDSLLVIS